LPERVNRLADVVGSSAQPASPSRRVAQRNTDDDLLEDPQMPRPAPSRSGISKIIRGMGNLITGGGYGAYSMGSNLVSDPQTGMLLDMYSGNLIDPRTGAVVGNRATGLGSSTFGALPYTGFNNGLSPMGVPYGMSTGGMRFGSGVGTGFGGGTRFGGMGFGTGLGQSFGMWP
jgi:hypothetical protein